MKYIDADGARVPALGLGTWQLTGRECEEAVTHALDIGYRHIDTAQAYDNEREVGRAIASSSVPRDEVFLTTKIWWENLRPEQTIDSVRRSLDRLGTDVVDLLLIHWPAGEPDIEEPLRAMTRLKEQGTARLIGVSNFTPSLFRRAVEVAPVACNQVEYHPYLDQSELRDLARQHDAFLTAYSPLARGRVAGEETLQEIGARHGKTAAQVALRWLIQQEGVAAIPKAASAEHRESDLDVFDFELSEDEMTTVSGLDRGERLIDPSFAPDWER